LTKIKYPSENYGYFENNNYLCAIDSIFLGANSWLANLNKCLTGAVFWKVTFADWGDSRQHHFAGN
jgi:hypothetical protein